MNLRHNVEQKKPDKEQYILNGSIYMKLKKSQDYIGKPWKVLTGKGHKGAFQCPTKFLCRHMDGHYTYVYTHKNS